VVELFSCHSFGYVVVLWARGSVVVSDIQEKSKERPESMSVVAYPQLRVVSLVVDLPEEPSEAVILLDQVYPEY